MGPKHALDLTPAPPGAPDSNLRLYVIYTTREATRSTLQAASVLARDLSADIEVLVPTVVPFPVPLDGPGTAAAFTENLVARLVDDSGVDASINVLLCRDREETTPRWIPAEAIALIGRRRRWGAGSARGLIRAVRRRTKNLIIVNQNRLALASEANPRERTR